MMARKMRPYKQLLATLCVLAFFGAQTALVQASTGTITDLAETATSPSSERITGSITAGGYVAGTLSMGYGVGTDRSNPGTVTIDPPSGPITTDTFTINLTGLTAGTYNFTISDATNILTGGFPGGTGSFSVVGGTTVGTVTGLVATSTGRSTEKITGSITAESIGGYNSGTITIDYGIGADRTYVSTITILTRGASTDTFEANLIGLSSGTYNFAITDDTYSDSRFVGGAGSFTINGATISPINYSQPDRTSETLTATITAGLYDAGSFYMNYGVCADQSNNVKIMINSNGITTDGFRLNFTGLEPGIYNFSISDNFNPNGYTGGSGVGSFTILNKDGSNPDPCPAPGTPGSYSSPVPGQSMPSAVGLAAKFVGKNLGTITAAVLQCKSVQNAIKSGLSLIASFFGINFKGSYANANDPGDKTASLSEAGSKTGAAGDYKTQSITSSSTTVPSNDKATQAKLQQLLLEQQTASNNTGKTAASTTLAANKLTCFQTIERAAAQIILREITKQTIDWINNGGFPKGSPLYVQDPSGSLQKIADQTVGDFTASISADSSLFPFGKDAAKSLIQQTGNYFEQNSRYSLNKVLAQRYPGVTSADFSLNFSAGGWNGFDSLLMPNNNPYGFNFGAESELSNRLRDTGYSQAIDFKAQMARNNGFLDLRKCQTPSGSDTGIKDMTKCKPPNRVMTVTPGGVIASSLTKALGTTQDTLLGNDITTDIGAILDALLNHYMQEGLKNIKV